MTGKNITGVGRPTSQVKLLDLQKKSRNTEVSITGKSILNIRRPIQNHRPLLRNNIEGVSTTDYYGVKSDQKLQSLATKFYYCRAVAKISKNPFEGNVAYIILIVLYYMRGRSMLLIYFFRQLYMDSLKRSQ